ncbi:cell wall protein DAN4 isoform X1, partial [Biomphalaria glabrata]
SIQATMKPATNFLYVTLSSLIVNAVDFQVSLSVSLQNEGNSSTAKFTCSWTANTDTKVTYVAFHYWINSVYWKVRSVYACKVGLNFLSCDQGRFWDEQFGVESNKPDSINFTLSNLTTMENVTYYCSVLAFNNAYTAQATIENISETIITTTTLSKPETSPTDSPSPTLSDSMTSPTDSPSSTWSDSMTSLRKSSKSETSRKC